MNILLFLVRPKGELKGAAQERDYVLSRLGFRRLYPTDDMVQFSAVKPESITPRTAINEHFLYVSEVNLIHFMPADRAFPPGFGMLNLIGREQVGLRTSPLGFEQ